jgi:hypothetical protein
MFYFKLIDFILFPITRPMNYFSLVCLVAFVLLTNTFLNKSKYDNENKMGKFNWLRQGRQCSTLELRLDKSTKLLNISPTTRRKNSTFFYEPLNKLLWLGCSCESFLLLLLITLLKHPIFYFSA